MLLVLVAFPHSFIHSYARLLRLFCCARGGNMVTRFLLLLRFSILFGLVPVLADDSDGYSTCYFPNGTISTDTFPCNTDGHASACCPADSACLDSPLCWTSWQELTRGTCSDSSWSDSACPAFCETGTCTWHVPSPSARIVN